jgi:hypothetical protein
MTRFFAIFFFTFIVNSIGFAQNPIDIRKFGLPIIKDFHLIGTKWKYAYTLQVESKTIIHKADENYQYFLFFKYDYSYEQFLNGKLTKGDWVLSNNLLKYNFKGNDLFEVAEYNGNILALEFNQINSKGTYRYYFNNVETKDAPFIKSPNELPEVVITETKKKNRKPWWSIFSKSDEIPTSTKEKEFLNVELIGGGYYGGIDPVYKDYVKINTEGRLIKEFQSANTPLIVTKKTIPREELEKFIAYVEEQGFFDMQRMYDCETAACEKRKYSKPTPIPLRISITKGSRRKIITITIWGLERNKMRYINYPQSLDYIIDAIQRFSNGIDG